MAAELLMAGGATLFVTASPSSSSHSPCCSFFSSLIIFLVPILLLAGSQTCGRRLIQGESIDAILKDMTVEGVPTASVAVAYADMCGLELPIFRLVDALIKGELTPEEAAPRLMGRPARGTEAAK
jgi:hypothetical protein